MKHHAFRISFILWLLPFMAVSLWAQTGPTITAQPTSQFAILGSTVTLSVTATASSSVSYQWLLNNQNVPGANSSTLVINNVQSYHGGTYRVIVTADGVSVNSLNAQLSIQLPPTITRQPPSYTGPAGSNYGLYAYVSGTDPFTYQWKKDGVVLPTETSYYLSLTLGPATAGTYTVTITNAAGSVTSDPAVIASVPAIVVTSPPSSQTVDAGGTINLTVTATGPGMLEYQWYRNGDFIPGATSPALTVSNAKGSDSGTYSVYVKNTYQPSGVSSSANVTVKAAPAFVVQPQSTAVFTSGNTATFSVAAAGAGPITYQWRKNGVNLTDSSTLSGATSSYLIFYSVTPDLAGTYSVVATNQYGSTTSTESVVTVTSNPFGPQIITQPQSLSSFLGGVATFSVVATSNNSSSFTYQWKKNDVAIPGAIASSFTIPSVTSADAGNYSVTISNYAASVASNSAVLTVGAAAVAPTILEHPANVSGMIGDTVTFKVTASGTPSPTYVWQKNGAILPGATSAQLTLTNIQAGDAGTYTAIASNSIGSATSAPATLTLGASNRARLINLSSRAEVGTGANILIAGFIITGSTPKKMLVRALGPTLTRFGVDGVLVNPSLKVVSGSGETLASNDDWGVATNLAELTDATARSGATPLPADSKDSAVVVTLAPGNYTALVSGVGNTTGVALVEVWDVESSSPTQLTNLSSRAFVGTDAKVLIGGLIVSGTTPRKFLVRAVGPGLQQFNVPGVLADPTLDVVDSSQVVIASNDNWSASPNVSEIRAASQGLFPLADNSKDAVALLTLSPGGYTVVVRGAGNSTGVALVELYQLP